MANKMTKAPVQPLNRALFSISGLTTRNFYFREIIAVSGGFFPQLQPFLGRAEHYEERDSTTGEQAGCFCIN